MDHRRKRIRQLISRLNKTRRSQRKKIDILCNDMLQAHAGFIEHLQRFSFAANFYETILSETDLHSLLNTAAESMTAQADDFDIAILLTGMDQFDVNLRNSSVKTDITLKLLQDCFSDSLIRDICHSNKICSVEDMCGMGLQASPAVLSKITMAAIGLGRKGTPQGVLLLYRSAGKPLRIEQFGPIASITKGLANAIRSCKTSSPAVRQ